jgi:hypothetical protein
VRQRAKRNINCLIKCGLGLLVGKDEISKTVK